MNAYEELQAFLQDGETVEYIVVADPPDSNATCIWTDRRIIWVTQNGSSTRLDSAPRNMLGD